MSSITGLLVTVSTQSQGSPSNMTKSDNSTHMHPSDHSYKYTINILLFFNMQLKHYMYLIFKCHEYEKYITVIYMCMNLVYNPYKIYSKQILVSKLISQNLGSNFFPLYTTTIPRQLISILISPIK